MQIERYCARELQLAFAFTLQVAAFRSDYYPPPRARRVLSYPSCTKRICIKASFSTPSSIYALNPRKTYPHELRESRVRIVDRFSKLEKMWYTTQRRTNERKSYEKCDCALVTVVKKRDVPVEYARAKLFSNGFTIIGNVHVNESEWIWK